MARMPHWIPTCPRMRTCSGSYTGLLVAEGPLAMCLCSLQEHPLSHVLAGLCSMAPLPWGGALHLQNPATVALCLVLQLSLPCALGVPLAASSWKPSPQTPPTF